MKVRKKFNLITIMRKKLIYFSAIIALAASAPAADAQSPTVATVPEGMITFKLAHGTTSYISLPLTNNEIYSSSVTAVTNNTITVGDSPAPFTTSLATSGSPYFVKFLSGLETGRIVLITANTASSLTLDITDHVSGSSVALTTPNFWVQPGDTFEIFPGDTLASVFGANTTGGQLILTAGTSATTADIVSIYTTSSAPVTTYYFNVYNNHWQLNGSTLNANSTIIYPHSAFTVTRRSNHPDTTLVLAGRVTPVEAEIKVVSLGTIYASTHFPTDVKLSQLQFGSNWTTGTSAITADNLSVWNPRENNFDVYYQKPDSTWRKSSDATTDQSGFAISAGAVTTIHKRAVVTGAASFLHSPVPYTLD